MNDPYRPWQPQQSYPSMDDSSSLDELARRRQSGNIRQREGGLPSFLRRLMDMYKQQFQGQSQPPQQGF